MATEKRTYPSFPIQNWWDLRKKFRTTVPRMVDAGYLATVLQLQEPAAANLVPQLRRLGLVDEAGKPTQRANLWRDDAHYPEVCKTILEETYPSALIDAAPPPDPDRDAVARWFARETGAGAGAAAKMARTYLLIAKAEAAEADAAERPAASSPKAKRADAPKPKATNRPSEAARPDTEPAPAPSSSGVTAPGLHIDIQVHIDSKASAEQIDQIFASMARHLYGKG